MITAMKFWPSKIVKRKKERKEKKKKRKKVTDHAPSENIKSQTRGLITNN